ncbi:MAG: shikimate dehydrogenase [Gammaproteobacteria bacterium]|nr:shikimate dehydrogenase [Gammaproteobacteria bacterium]
MDRYAVLGQPIAHSLSPRIHALFAQATGARLDYTAIEVAPAALAETLHRLHAAGYAGLNLTLPHKIDAAALCAALSQRAHRAGAVNTLIRTDAGWHGDNTDGLGLVCDLSGNLGLKLAGLRTLILGAGGAARGILAPLLAQGVAELVLSGRTPWQPEELAKAFAALGPIRPCTHLALKGDSFDLVINATSAGHAGQVPQLPPGLFAAGAVAYDLGYGKAARPFLEWARTHGAARTADGLGLLVEQAAEAFLRWRGVRPQTAAVLASLRAG